VSIVGLGQFSDDAIPESMVLNIDPNFEVRNLNPENGD
jgi:hypothetical protein